MESPPLKVVTVFGTRPETIKLAPILKIMENDARLENVVVSTAQHREMVDKLLRLFDLRVNYDLDIMQPGQSLSDITTRVLKGLDPILKAEAPDLLLVQGDTTTTLAGAQAAFYQRIPVGHVEAGLRSFDKNHPYPEEVNRRMITAIADLHFAPTWTNQGYLNNEGIDPEQIFVTGNPAIDSLLHTRTQPLRKRSHGLPLKDWANNRLILVTAHRRENHGPPLESLCEGLRFLAAAYQDVQIVYAVHPNPKVREVVHQTLGQTERIHLVDPISYPEFIELMDQCHFLITDSGGIQEEAPTLNRPVLVFRKVTERTEAIELGGVRLVDQCRDNLIREAAHLLDDTNAYAEMVGGANPFGDGLAGERIVQAILHHFGLEKRPADFVPARMPTRQRGTLQAA